MYDSSDHSRKVRVKCYAHTFRNVLWIRQNFEERTRNTPNYWYVISRQKNGNQGVFEKPVSLVIVSKGFLCSSIRKKTNSSGDPGMTNGSHWSVGWTTSNALKETFQTTDSTDECYRHFACISSKCVTFRKPHFFIVLVTIHEQEQSGICQQTARSEL